MAIGQSGSQIEVICRVIILARIVCALAVRGGSPVLLDVSCHV